MKFLSWALEGGGAAAASACDEPSGRGADRSRFGAAGCLCPAYGAGVLYALWLLPAARLLIPGSIGSAFSF